MEPGTVWYTAYVRPDLPSKPSDHTSLLTTSPLPTPAYPEQANMSFSVIARTKIAAPAPLVFGTILHADTWGEWNTFIPKTTVTGGGSATPYPAGIVEKEGQKWLREGDRMVMRCNMAGTPLSELSQSQIDKLVTTPTHITMISTINEEKEAGRRGFRLLWKYDAGREWFLKTERVQEVVELEDGGCEFVTWESFGGWGASLVRVTTGEKLVLRFAQWGDDLKRVCEAKAKIEFAEEGR